MVPHKVHVQLWVKNAMVMELAVDTIIITNTIILQLLFIIAYLATPLRYLKFLFVLVFGFFQNAP